jgi:hypothetical protein
MAREAKIAPVKMAVPCPICGAKNNEHCIKGEINSDLWHFKEKLGPNGEMHDRRRVANGLPSLLPPRRKPIPATGSDVE